MRYILLLFILLFVSCQKEPPGQHPIPPQLPERTVIVYMCGDNNLSAEVDIKIMALRQGMERVGKTTDNVIVFADYRDRMPELFRITDTERISLHKYTEMNSASPENMREILESIIEEHPAHSYGLICFSHASGWLPPGALNNPEKFPRTDLMNKLRDTSSSFDVMPFHSTENHSLSLSIMDTKNNPSGVTRSIFDDGGSEMTIQEFAGALPELPNGGKFEFILFEACYMASVEVAYELRHKTKYVVASAAEILSDGFVSVYPQGLPMLLAPEPQLKEFAQAYFDVWNSKTDAKRSATVSVINTEGIEGLADAVRSIYANDLSVDASSVQHFNRNSYHLFFDLSDVIGRIATDEQTSRYERALASVVEYAAATPLFMQGYPYAFTIDSHCGLTTYIPQSHFPALNEEYEALEWVVKTALPPTEE